MRERKAVMLTALFFALLTLIGLATAPDYGLPCDEPAEQIILQENLMEYSLALLGQDSPPAVYYRQRGITPISQSIERDHGQSAYYLAAPILQWQADAPDTAMTLWHGYTWLWFMVGVLSLYLLLRRLGAGRLVACAGALLLYLSPRFFAEGHYNNKDMVLLSLTLLTVAAGAQWMIKPTWRRAVLFSLAGALAANTKIVGLFVWGLMGLATALHLRLHGKLTRQHWCAAAVAIITFVLTYWLLTPAAWRDPVAYLQYILHNATGFSRWSGVVLFRGVLYNPTRGMPLPRTYLPLMVLYTLPTLTLLLAAGGQVLALVRILRKDGNAALLAALTVLWLVPMVFVVAARPLMYNGWRHFYFLFAGIAALAGYGLVGLAKALQGKVWRQRIAVCAMAAALLLQAVGIARNHPYQYVYYNALAQNTQTEFEQDYWLVSTVNAMRDLLALQASGSNQPLVLGARDPMSLFGVQHGAAVLSARESERLKITEDETAPYLLYNTTYARIYDVPPPEGYQEILHIESYGSVITTVYQQSASLPQP